MCLILFLHAVRILYLGKKKTKNKSSPKTHHFLFCVSRFARWCQPVCVARRQLVRGRRAGLCRCFPRPARVQGGRFPRGLGQVGLLVPRRPSWRPCRRPRRRAYFCRSDQRAAFRLIIELTGQIPALGGSIEKPISAFVLGAKKWSKKASMDWVHTGLQCLLNDAVTFVRFENKIEMKPICAFSKAIFAKIEDDLLSVH